MSINPKTIARALGREVFGCTVLVPSRGHRRADRSFSVKVSPAAADGFIVHSFAGDSPVRCREVSAKMIAKALGGRRAGRGWVARCPAHDDRQPSLSIDYGDDGSMLVHCHAGCDQARVISVLRSRGLWDYLDRRRLDGHGGVAGHRLTRDNRTQPALAIWNAAMPAAGTLVETYLAFRGLGAAPSTLRFHVGLKHPEGNVWPAMQAKEFLGAIHAGDPTATGARR